jgi:hypothetical protein
MSFDSHVPAGNSAGSDLLMRRCLAGSDALFVHLRAGGLAAVAAACRDRPAALPVRATFAYRKRKGRRECVRVSQRNAADGAGIITSLTETDGLTVIGFLSHAQRWGDGVPPALRPQTPG